MISVALFLCVLTVVKAGPRAPTTDYAEDSHFYAEQNLSVLIAIEEPLFVKQRNYKTNTTLTCLSATKIGDLGNNQYNYTLKARSGTINISYPVTMTANKTGNHTTYNAVIYKEDPDEPEMNHKIVTMNDNHTCFVLVRAKENSTHECFIVVTASSAKQDIPRRCQQVYDFYCPGNSTVLYNENCTA
uniref:Putative lipocalin n=1 Tax=Rhipicephalus microplus TaxID=6941 RepID=A0A6G5A781_RHIMP